MLVDGLSFPLKYNLLDGNKPRSSRTGLITRLAVQSSSSRFICSPSAEDTHMSKSRGQAEG